MGSYYWNSLFNIATAGVGAASQPQGTGEDNGGKGIFQPRDLCGIQPCHVQVRYYYDLDCVDAAVHVALYIANEVNWQFAEHSPLDSQAWILQERILALRTLFFGKLQMSFSCLTMRASEACLQGSKLQNRIETCVLIEEY